jgi:integrase
MQHDGVYRLGQHRGKWVALYGRGRKDKRRLTLDADSGKAGKDEAQRQIRELNLKAARAEFDKDLTVETVFTLYVQDRERDGIPSVKRMREAWKPLAPHFGHLGIEQINKKLCTEYTAKRRRLGVSNGGIRTELDYLSTALRFGKREKLFTCDTPAIERPPQARPRERWLTKAEVTKLVRCALVQHIKLFILLAVATAGRPSHILQLTWPRVDLGARIINLDDPDRDLTQKGRARVPINDDIYEPLRMARDLAETKFVIEYNGHPVKSVKKGIAEAARRAKIKGISPYVLRHTAGVWMAQAGVPMAEIAQYMGHTNPAVTFKVYARYHPDYLRKASGALMLGDGPLAIEDQRT